VRDIFLDILPYLGVEPDYGSEDIRGVNFTVPANYTKDSKTYKVVCAIIDKIKADCELKRLSKSAF
jgi:hypothetical protein